MAKQRYLIIAGVFFNKNKAFLGPRCDWCGKTRHFWFPGAFGVVNQAYLDNCFALWRFVGLPGFSWHSVAQWSN